MVPNVIKFLGTEGDLGANQGVVGVTVSIVKCTGGADSMEVFPAGGDKVKLVPVFGSWVHSGYTVLPLDCKECVGNAELVMCSELEEPLPIFIQGTSLFLMAKPTPCSLRSSSILLGQKNV